MPALEPEPQPAALLLTERLRLDPLLPADAAILAGLWQDDWPAIQQTGRMPYPATEPALRRWLCEHAVCKGELFLIRRQADQVPLGMIGYGGSALVAEMGYILGRPFWRHGYATEAARATLARARTLGVRRLDAYSFVENPASAVVLAKAGMTELGIVERSYPLRGGMRRVRHFRAML